MYCMSIYWQGLHVCMPIYILARPRCTVCPYIGKAYMYCMPIYWQGLHVLYVHILARPTCTVCPYIGKAYMYCMSIYRQGLHVLYAYILARPTCTVCLGGTVLSYITYVYPRSGRINTVHIRIYIGLIFLHKVHIDWLCTCLADGCWRIMSKLTSLKKGNKCNNPLINYHTKQPQLPHSEVNIT